MNNYQVTNISVEQGLIEYINPDANAQTDFGALDGPSLFLSSAAAISMQWVVAQLSCEEARHNMSGYACASANSECKTIRHTGGYVGYRCNCISGYVPRKSIHRKWLCWYVLSPFMKPDNIDDFIFVFVFMLYKINI